MEIIRFHIGPCNVGCKRSQSDIWNVRISDCRYIADIGTPRANGQTIVARIEFRIHRSRSDRSAIHRYFKRQGIDAIAMDHGQGVESEIEAGRLQKGPHETERCAGVGHPGKCESGNHRISEIVGGWNPQAKIFTAGERKWQKMIQKGFSNVPERHWPIYSRAVAG